MKLLFYVVCVLSFCGVSYAQLTVKISGKVIDSATLQPIEYATITVTDKSAQKVINGAITDAGGSFAIDNLPAGTYKIVIDFLGYNKRTIDPVVLSKDAKIKQLNTILLVPSKQMLRDVTINGDAPIIENKIDKMVYNAANDITSQGGAALDVLKKVPQVTVDIDGNVELQGSSNISFLINGKPSSVFGNSIADALAAIPASQIKSIEVITSPGAKYDAQGTGGIINIVLKDNKMQGVNASINLSAGTRLENGSATLNIRHNNFGVNLYFNGNAQIPSRTPAMQDRSSTDASGSIHHLIQDGYSDFERNGFQTGLGFDWNITKRDNITGYVSYNQFGNSGNGITNILEDSATCSKSPIVRNSTSSSLNSSIDFGVSYKKNFKKEGQELNASYSSSFGDPHADYAQSMKYLSTATPYTSIISNNPGTDRGGNFSVDYSHPFTKHFMMETGLKAVLQNITSIVDVQNLNQSTNTYASDAGQSYHLKYDRQVYAGYLSASFQIAKYLKVKAGARYEHTDSKIDFPNTTIPPYNTLVPSVTFSHDLKNSFIKLAYTRRIERPDYRDVNPFLNRADPYNITTGNPLLKPEVGNNFELGFNRSFGKGSNLYIALIERINTQDHKQVTTFYPEYTTQGGDTLYNVSISAPQNAGTEYNTGITISGSWAIKDKISLRGNVSAFDRYMMTGSVNGNVSAGVRVRTNLNVTYQFPHNLITEAFGNYNSASGNIQGRSPQSVSYTFAMRKQSRDKNASLGITATNLFNKYTKQITTITTSNYTSYNERLIPYRSVGISFTYKIGRLEFRKGKEDDNYINNPPVMGS